MKKLVVAKVLAGAGVAVAASAAGASFSTPDAATDGLDTANSHAAVEVTAAGGEHGQDPVHPSPAPEETTVEVESTEEADPAERAGQTPDVASSDAPAPQGEHGAAVVAAVEASEPGPERGEAVSSVASEGRSDEGRAHADN